MYCMCKCMYVCIYIYIYIYIYSPRKAENLRLVHVSQIGASAEESTAASLSKD